METFNAQKVKDQIVQWIRDWFEENVKGCNAVIGISGGKDSSVVAGLCVEALGVDRVIGVQPDIDDSMKLINYLGFTYAVLDKYVYTSVCNDPKPKALIDHTSQTFSSCSPFRILR